MERRCGSRTSVCACEPARYNLRMQEPSKEHRMITLEPLRQKIETSSS